MLLVSGTVPSPLCCWLTAVASPRAPDPRVHACGQHRPTLDVGMVSVGARAWLCKGHPSQCRHWGLCYLLRAVPGMRSGLGPWHASVSTVATLEHLLRTHPCCAKMMEMGGRQPTGARGAWLTGCMAEDWHGAAGLYNGTEAGPIVTQAACGSSSAGRAV